MATVVRDLEIPPTTGDYVGGKIVGDGDLHLQVKEYSNTIHFDLTYSRHLPRGVVEASIAGP